MNTSNPWANLPNAKHIDRINASWDQHRGIWDSALNKCNYLVSEELRIQAIDEAMVKCKELVRLDIWREPRIPSIDSMLTLIAYDDCAHYLEYTSQELTTIALLGVAPAVLLLRAVLAFEEIAKISH